MDTTLSDLALKAIDQQSATYIALFAIAVISLIVVLVAVIIVQRRHINELKRPKYGFLGKPLYLMALVAFSVVGIGAVYYSTNNSTNVEQTKADRKVDLKIVHTFTGKGYDYTLNLIPNVDGKPWGGNSDLTFDVYWSIDNGKSVVMQAEIGLNLDHQGGITKTLTPGKNKIKATVFFGGKSYEQTAEISI